jgi:glycosyltransferase involved in cell wall biosynthesis
LEFSFIEWHHSVKILAMLISVIIPAFNEEKFLKQTIEKIKLALNENKDKDFSWEIIVCDNNSNDGTTEVASKMGVKIAFEPINQISKARNTGSGIAQGDWFLFIDADSYPRPELIAEVLNLIDNGNYIGCGTTVMVEGGTLFNKLRMERLNPIFRLLNLCGGVFILCQREAFQSIQGFSTNLYAYEELDFVIRLKKYGRLRGMKFTVLHRHPVITSGRKGEYHFFSLAVLFASNIVALLLFGLHYLLPKRLITKVESKLLGYWYNGRR